MPVLQGESCIQKIKTISYRVIYADTAAYQSHITTTHFKKYKETVKDMVKSLELVDVTLIGSANKLGM